MKLATLATTILLSATFPSIGVLAENVEHTQQLLSTKSCPGCDLSGAGLVFAQLAGANLARSNLVRANLSQADLTGADLSQANLVGASLSNANLGGANLMGASLVGADLRGAYLMNVNLEGADLTDANLMGATGIPVYAVEAEDLLLWANQEAGRGNFQGAISYYDEALTLDPDFAQAYLSRSAARNRLGDRDGALSDAQRASEIFFIEGDRQGYDAAKLFASAIELEIQVAEEGARGPGFLDTLGNIGITLLQFGLF
ncbi:pentapeptide repeat-containing protein [Oscillatoriales cyanobacterium LEGE 11467]|uniref:Pentapeptide repeat-containing protein n=1 Tax=Zarconia navalis LEGE 11467 TaxID=1828826 RepID=A0A928Z6J6_9CYAN|nr:pentapeptide repeat-containing protein [Zarconia navalis]MBE9040432.1 pentapeptide repeat-containing protein [Zarconia navalis LEGE 11467]